MQKRKKRGLPKTGSSKKRHKGPHNKKKASQTSEKTSIDELFTLINSHKKLDVSTLAALSKIEQAKVINIVELLSKKGFIRMKYTLLGRMVAYSLDYDKKK